MDFLTHHGTLATGMLLGRIWVGPRADDGRWRVWLAMTVLIAATATPAAQPTEDDRFAALRLPPPTYPDATGLMADGQAVEALRRLEAATGDGADAPLEWFILRATLLAQAGRPDDAERAWASVIDRAVFMRTFARRAIVASRVTRGRPAEAAPIVDELWRSDPARHRDLVLQMADAFLAAGEADRAATAYRRVLDTTTRSRAADAARLGLARTELVTGHPEAALTRLRDAQLRHRDAATVVDARAEARALADRHDVAILPFTDAEYRDLVRRLRTASRFDAALELLDEWARVSPEGEVAGRRAIERVETLYAQRDNEAAVAEAARVYRDFPQSPRLPAVRLTDFRLAVRMGDVDRAERLGRDLWEGRVPGADTAQRRAAALLLGAYLGATGDNETALEMYRGLFQTATAADEQRDLLWRAGVAALRDGQNERARTNLEGLVDRGPSGDLELSGQYWLAVARLRTGDETAGIRMLRALAGRYPYHYYGLTARDRLQEVDAGGALDELPAPPLLDFPPLAVGQATIDRAEYRAAMALAKAGVISDAAWYLRRLLDRQRGDRGLALLAARASAAAGDYAGITRILVDYFGPYLQRPTRGRPPDFWSLVFPRPFWDTVVDSADRHGADPLLLVSLMRRESRFDPSARSPVGAVGLLQIMRYTAEALAERAGVAHILDGELDDTVLAEPPVNIAIAARLNADLLGMFDGERLPVIASYNAGEDHVAEWWAGTRHLRTDFFVDTIPYGETRRFAREVVSNYAAYERIYGSR